MLTTNRKLGNHVASFNIPAVTTCPGKSKLCSQVCYADSGLFVTPIVKTALRRNYDMSRSNEFASAMVLSVKSSHAKTIRIHASGDFDSVAYIRKWIEIVRKCRNKTFFSYTRSWRIKRLKNDLRKLAGQPNMLLWFSTDKELHKRFGRPPKWRRTRVAYMAVDDNESIPSYVDLVFRVTRSSVAKYLGGKLVCPAENGVHGQLKMQCSNCKLCFSDRQIPEK